MRVAVASWSPRRVGGVEEYVALLLPAMHAAGLEVAFWHEVEEPRARDRLGVPSGVPDICAVEVGLEASISRLRDWKPDVVYSQGVRDVGAEAKLLDVAPAVFFLHTYTGTCISGRKTFSRPVGTPCDRTFGWPCLVHYFPHGCGGNDPLTMWRLYKIQSLRLDLLHRYRRILTHTDHMRHEMERHGLTAEVVPYPVEAPIFSEMSPGDGRWRLLYIARMETLKGGHLLLQALPSIARAAPRGVRVTMAGDGPSRPQWEATARDLQTRTPNLTVEFAGWLTQRQVGAHMNNADLLVVPSLWGEPLGAIGPAAGHLGLPAAAFASGGIPQWLTDGVNGHLAPADPPRPEALAAAVVRCLEDPLHYASLRKGAREMAAPFTMQKHMPELLRVLEHAAAGKRRQ